MTKAIFIIVLYLISQCKTTRVPPKRHLARHLQFRGEVLDSLYNVYDPTFLAIVWNTLRNGVHLAVSNDCYSDARIFFRDFSRGRPWAYIAADASGHYNSGAFSGRRHWLGSKRQCLDLDNNNNNKKDKETLEKYQKDAYLNEAQRRDFSHGEEWASEARPPAADSAPPLRLAFTTVHLTLNVTKASMSKCHEIIQGVCLPRSCTADDVIAIMNFSIVINNNFKYNKTIPRTVRVTAARRIDQDYDITRDVGAIVLFSITMTILLLAAIATLVDFKLIKCNTRSQSKSFDLQQYNNTVDRTHTCGRKESNLIDMESLTINNINNSNNINLVTVKKVVKHNAAPPSITLDVVSLEKRSGSCKRCGKYKKQCSNPKRPDSLAACPRVKYNSIVSLTDEKSLFHYLLLCFSLSYSWRRIFNTNMANKDLSIMHALRIVTTFWVVFIHVATVVSYLSDKDLVHNEHNNVYMILATGTLAFDTLFFVSGLFSAYHFFYLKSQYSVEELVSFSGVCGQFLQFCCFITNRAVRLLPSYAYAIFLSAILSRVYQHTASLELPEADQDCDVNWWRNLLYVTNLYPREERCMQISWYLTSETQLHAIGAFICAIMAARRRAALSLAALAVMAATAADVISAYTEYGQPVSDVYATYSVLMDRPWARAAPYLIGVFAGWLVRRMEGRLHVTKVTGSLVWVASLFSFGIACVVPWVRPAWLSALLHLVWPAVLLWPALVCATNYADASRRLLDSGAVAALSRLCYSVLLLHGIVIRLLLLSIDDALCSDTICIWSYFAGTTLVTLLASLSLSLLVEMPCCSLLRRLSDCANK